MKQTIYNCDHCWKQVQKTGIVECVEVVFGGDGAARSKVDGIDLCRECYGELVSAIRGATDKPPLAHPSGRTHTR